VYVDYFGNQFGATNRPRAILNPVFASDASLGLPGFTATH
jgi:hypothetical protein